MITHRWHQSKLILATGTVIYFIRERNTFNFWEWFVSNPIFCQIATIASNLSKERALANPVMLYTKSNPSWWIKWIFSPNFFFNLKWLPHSWSYSFHFRLSLFLIDIKVTLYLFFFQFTDHSTHKKEFSNQLWLHFFYYIHVYIYYLCNIFFLFTDHFDGCFPLCFWLKYTKTGLSNRSVDYFYFLAFFSFGLFVQNKYWV